MSTLQTLGFGSGIIFASPNGGNLPTNPTPIEVGVLQDAKVTLSGDIKELYGQLQFPVDSAIGKRSIKGTINYALIEALTWNSLFFADNVVSGAKALAYREPHTIPAETPSVTVNNSVAPTPFIEDGGVRFADTGQPAVRATTAGPNQGQYTVAANGLYTFNEADEGRPVLISYRYGTVTGQTLQISAHNMGYGPVVSLLLQEPYQGNYQGLWLPNVRVGKIDMSTKIDDYTMQSSDFSAFATPAGIVGEMYAPW